MKLNKQGVCCGCVIFQCLKGRGVMGFPLSSFVPSSSLRTSYGQHHGVMSRSIASSSRRISQCWTRGQMEMIIGEGGRKKKRDRNGGSFSSPQQLDDDKWHFLLSSSTFNNDHPRGGGQAQGGPDLPPPTSAQIKRRALAVLGGTSLFTLLAASMLRILPLGHRALIALSPLVFTLIPYYLCLGGGLPLAGVGSWKSLASIGHRIGGIGTLVSPLLMVLYEAFTSTHVPTPFYIFSIMAIALNLIFGAVLIPRSFPAYDIPAARGLAVGTFYGWAFLGWSLTFRLGGLGWYEPIGKLFALVALYGVCFSWSDAIQNMYYWAKGLYKSRLGKKWYLPFEPSTYRQVFFTNIYKRPTPEALKASLMTAWQGSLPTIFVAIFGSSCLLQLTYLKGGTNFMQWLSLTYPDLARWASYQALLAVAANNFATFLVTLVVHNRMPMNHVAFYNFMVPLIPLFNIVAFTIRYNALTPTVIVKALLHQPA